MAALTRLLDRYCQRPEGLSVDQRLSTYRDAEVAAGRGWVGWCEAERAMRTESPRLALAWIDAAWPHTEDEALCRLELLTLYARSLAALDEPRQAIGPAQESFDGWRTAIDDLGIASVLQSARELIKILSEPHDAPDLADDVVLVVWIEDRCAPLLASSATQLVKIYGDLGVASKAEQVYDDYAEWMVRRLRQLGGSADITSPELANLDLTLGDAFDRCGQGDRALEVFERGLAATERLPSSAWTDSLRAQLEFNIAGQVARQGRFEEAEQAYRRAEDDMAALGWVEPVLRAQYARNFMSWKQGHVDGLVDKFTAVADGYEQMLAAVGPTSEEIESRQGLDLTYRMILRLRVDSLDQHDETQVHLLLMLLFMLKEEDGKFVRLSRELSELSGTQAHSELTILVERLGQRPSAALMIVEQVPEAIVVVTLRGGAEPWHEHVNVTRVDVEDAGPITDLIGEHSRHISALSDRILPLKSPVDAEFTATCQAAWALLDSASQDDISDLEELYLTVDYQTDLDQLPVELMHDGDNYLGLSTCVSRFPSLQDVTVLLGQNRVNAAPTGTSIVVRAEDTLSTAESEVEVAMRGLAQLGGTVGLRPDPHPIDLLRELGDGVDVMHYIGHGMADKIGEELPLSPQAALSALDLQTLAGAPAPVAILSACLVGRGRHLRSGAQQGFAAALLRRGSPAVIGAQFPVPDVAGPLYWSYFYHFAAEASLGSALLQTRRQLAAEGYHPAIWSAFAIFGRPDTTLEAPHLSPPTAWSSRALRLLATNDEDERAAVRSMVAADERLTESARAAVIEVLDAVDNPPSTPLALQSDDESVRQALSAYSESMSADMMLRVMVRLRHAAARPDGWSRSDELRWLSLTERTLGDTYVLLALARELADDLDHLFADRQTFRSAATRIRWLGADPDLEAIAAEVSEAATQLDSHIAVDLGSMAGVDADTFAAADDGDRDAQKRMLSALWQRSASPESTLARDWKPWLLRAIGSGTQASLSDVLGAIEAVRGTDQLDAEQADAIVTLVERYVGPGAIESTFASSAHQVFADDVQSRTVIDLFVLHDAIASGERCSIEDVLDAAGHAFDLAAPAAAAHFLGVAAERAFREGDNGQAYQHAGRALELCRQATLEDPEYCNRTARTAFLFAQTANRQRQADEGSAAIEEGLRILEEALPECDEPGPPGELMFEVQAATMVLMMEGRCRQARELRRRADRHLDHDDCQELDEMLGPRPEFPDDPEAIGNAGSDFLHTGQLLSAIEWMSEAIHRFDVADDRASTCGLLGDLAVAFKNVGNWAVADATYRRAIERCQEFGDDTNLSRWSQNLGALLNEANEQAEGLTFSRLGLEAAKRSANSYQLSCAHGNLGVLFHQSDELAKAADHFELAIEAAPNDDLASQWRANQFETLTRWADDLVRAGAVPQGIDVQQRLVAALVEAEEEQADLAADALFRLAIYMAEGERTADALQIARRARAQYEALGDVERAEATRQLEEGLQNGGPLVNADDFDDEATLRAQIDAAVATGDVEGELAARAELAFALQLAEDPEAVDALDIALDRAQTHEDSRHEMNLALNFALWFLEHGDPNRALELARLAVDRADEAREPFQVVAHLHLARVLQDGLGDVRTAVAEYQRAMTVLRSTITDESIGLPEYLTGEQGNLALGTELVLEQLGHEAALEMLAVWNPDAARLGTGPAVADRAEMPWAELRQVLGAWRRSSHDSGSGDVELPVGDDDSLAAMTHLASISGWTEAEKRLRRARGRPGPPADISPSIARLLSATAGPDSQTMRGLDIPDSDLACVLLFALVNPTVVGDGAGYRLLQAVSQFAGDGLAARALSYLGMLESDPRAQLAYYQAGADRLEQGANDVLLAKLLGEQSAALIRLRSFSEAQEVATKSLALAEHVGPEANVMMARGNLAVALMELGQPDAALPIFEELAKLQQSQGDTQGLETTASNIATCRMKMGDFTTTEFDTAEDDLVNLFNEAQRLAVIDRPHESFELFERAFSLAEGDPHPEVSPAFVLMQYGRALVSGGLVREAILVVEKAAELSTSSGEIPLAAEIDEWLNDIRQILAEYDPNA